MNARCPHCGLHHRRRTDGNCPRCQQAIDRAPEAGLANRVATGALAAATEKSASTELAGAIRDPAGAVLSSAVGALDDAMLVRATGKTADELTAETKERWRSQAPRDALRGDWQQFKLEWRARLPIVVVVVAACLAAAAYAVLAR